MQLVDIGANLGHDSFDHDRAQVVDRARLAGVVQIVVTGSSLKSSQEAQKLAANWPGRLFATAGVHPHQASECDANTIPQLRVLAGLPGVVALGECGLDYNRDYSPRPTQDRWFEAQVQLAADLKMPLFLHERDAHARFVEILTPYLGALGPTVVHCFTGSESELDQYLAMGFYIGITGWICDERRGQHLKRLVSKIPRNRLMLETDAPYLIPRNIKPKPRHSRNEPAYLPYVLEAVADSLGVRPEVVASATALVSREFFRLPADTP